MNSFPDYSTPFQSSFGFANGEQMLFPAELAASAQMVGPEGLTHSHFIPSQLAQETKTLPETSLGVASPLATTNQSISPFYRYLPQLQHPQQYQYLPETEDAGYQANYSYSLPQFGYAGQQYAQYVPNTFDDQQEANTYLSGPGASQTLQITAQEAQQFLDPNAVSLALAAATNGYTFPQRWSPSPTPPLTDSSSLPSSVNPTPLATPFSRDINNYPLPDNNGDFWASTYVPTENIAGPSRLPKGPPPYMPVTGTQFGAGTMRDTTYGVPLSNGEGPHPTPAPDTEVRSSSQTSSGEAHRRTTSTQIFRCPSPQCPRREFEYRGKKAYTRHRNGPFHINDRHRCPNLACPSPRWSEGFSRKDKLSTHMKTCCPKLLKKRSK